MHLLRACEVSNLIIHNDKNGDISKDIFPMRKMLLKKNCSCFQEFKNKSHYTDLFEFNNLNYTHNNTGYSFLLYTASASGIKISSFFTSNPYIQFYTGRFFNLCAWLFLTFTAIKITPRFKWTFLVTALFPMTIYEGMSLSADSINNGFAFLYVAYTFYLAYNNKDKISTKELCFYIILSFLTPLTKGLFLLTLLGYLIPKSKLKYKYFILSSLIILTFFCQFIISSNSYILTANGVIPEARINLFRTEPFYVIQLFINTLIHKTTFYIQSSILRLGWWLYINPAPTAIYLLFTSYILSITLEEKTSNIFDSLISVIITIIYILLTISLYYLTFSPIDTGIIIGIQGRYFIPLYLVIAPFVHSFIKLLLKPFNIHNTLIYNSYIYVFIIITIIINLIYTLAIINFFWGN